MTSQRGIVSVTVMESLPLMVPKPLAIILLVVITMVVVLYFIRRGSHTRGNSIMLVGISDAGKTAILSTLVYGQTLSSHASLQTNTCILPLNKKGVTLVDIPGHPRIRAQFREHLPDAKVIVFVVDASSISRNGSIVAEYLHQILHAVVTILPSQNPPAILILAHKCDLLKSGTVPSTSSLGQLATNRVRNVLERELEKRRQSHTRSVAIDELGADGEDSSELGGLDCNGPPGESFKFVEWEGGVIEFIGTWVSIGEKVDLENEKSGNGSNDGLKDLMTWLETHI
ncbi:P-loop containing nucleoside triphosphate hydrolase protein [Multifurca ochricompacta]|uniref:Signal recognition particle receptor subunit beta n=1 Tax=Multifurca ochricompacta TaxID=376703 RepID=A0AAD4MA35_9AGAM|nr:P-loop containing nucleoside triphosphate hydrolase protein [Multifurca ochricompacta]